ncbi:MAG: nicotinate-nucleotide adenylyltransferase [Firmicutes bacterium]|nr:nicotinate-nucleotide adenylyltransferase [Bacillota bacterium]
MLQKKKEKRTALMGGTFDPIHYGHLSAAQFAAEEFNIDEVIFMPAGFPYFKEKSQVTPGDIRLVMTKLAVKGNSLFTVSDMEIKRQGETYTVDTMDELSRTIGGELFLITGSDAAAGLEKWHEPERLLQLCSVIVVSRPGSDDEWEEFRKTELYKQYEDRFLRLMIPGVDVSSTELRKRAAAGKSIKYLLPEEVENYILKNQIYNKNSLSDFDWEKAKMKLISAVSPKRYKHTLGVVDEAKRLCALWNGDAQKVEIAAFLHDCAKGVPKDIMLDMCRQYGVELDEDTLNNFPVIHQFLGAALAKAEYGISDEDVLNAIRYHTTGRAGMSLTEKIVFCADYTEAGRKDHDGLAEARQLVNEDLDKAVEHILRHTVEYIKENNFTLHSLSEEALNYYRKA